MQLFKPVEIYAADALIEFTIVLRQTVKVINPLQAINLI